MQYLKESTHSMANNSITMEHRGHTLVWSIKTYRTLKVDDNIIFNINDYWAHLPLDKQDAIFAIYKEIYEVFETVENTRELDKQLLRLVKALFEYHQFDDIMRYYHEHARIKVPQDLKDKYVSGLFPDLTYLKHEYPDLVGLAIAMKAMIPIWGTYINVIFTEAGSNYKEFKAAALLHDTEIIHSRAYLRLKRYIDAYWDGYIKEHSSAAILAGMAKDNVPEWLLGNVMIRRISTAKIIQANQPEQPTIIITDVYNFIESLVDAMDKYFGGRVNEKGLDPMGSGDDDNISVIENYKIKQQTSEGVTAMHDVYLRTRAVDILKRIDPTCPEEYYHEVKKVFNQTYQSGFELNDFSITLIKWTLDPVVTAKTIDEITYNAIIEGLFVTHALIRHWGFNHILMMLFAMKENTGMISNVVRQQVTEEQLDRLAEIYPHTPNSNIKRKLTRRESNVAMVAIRHLLTSLYGTWWRLAPWDKAANYPALNITPDGISPLPYDIEKVIADFIIFTRGVNHVKLYQTDETV